LWLIYRTTLIYALNWKAALEDGQNLWNTLAARNHVAVISLLYQVQHTLVPIVYRAIIIGTQQLPTCWSVDYFDYFYAFTTCWIGSWNVMLLALPSSCPSICLLINTYLLLPQYTICTPTMQYDVLNLTVLDIFSSKNNMSQILSYTEVFCSLCKGHI